jgi:hypothetical protein
MLIELFNIPRGVPRDGSSAFIGTVLHTFIKLSCNVKYNYRSIHYTRASLADIGNWSDVFEMSSDEKCAKINVDCLEKTFLSSLVCDSALRRSLERKTRVSELKQADAVQKASDAADAEAVVAFNSIAVAPVSHSRKDKMKEIRQEEGNSQSESQTKLPRVSYLDHLKAPSPYCPAPPPPPVDIRTDFRAELISCRVNVTSTINVTTVSSPATSSVLDVDHGGDLPFMDDAYWSGVGDALGL